MTLPKVPPNEGQLAELLDTTPAPDEPRDRYLKRVLRLVVAHHGQTRVANILGINVNNLRRTMRDDTQTRLDALCRAAAAVDLDVTLTARPVELWHEVHPPIPLASRGVPEP